MKKYAITFLVFSFAIMMTVNAQNADETLPYHQIPDYPDEYTSATVAARIIDGLGYRYYWATKDLRPEDLAYQPSAEGRTTDATLDHIYGLSRTILNAAKQVPNVRSDEEEMTYEQKRAKTLHNFAMASELLKNGEQQSDLSDYKVIFKRGDTENAFPFWNMLNGPIADAIWHSGQVVSFRRSSGNPLQAGVSVFTGKTRE